MEFLSYGFIQRALITGVFIAILCSVLGLFLVLRRLSLIGDGLAHVTFGSVALGLLLRVHPVYVSLPVVMLSSVGILKLTQKARVHGDAAIGILSSLGIAVGILIASVAGGFNVDLFSYLFGSILAISTGEMILSIICSLIVILTIIFFYHDLFSTTFDEESAKASGIRVERINILLVLLTAVTVVLTMRVVGIMLTSALLILPAVTALQISKGFKRALITSSIVAALSVMGGIFLSFVVNIPTGAVIVAINFVLFMTAFLSRKRAF